MEVAPFHTDFTGELTVGMLGNHLLNCAGFHAGARGFNGVVLDGEEYLWVLSRLVIEIEKMPREYDHIAVETWIDSVYRFFTNRHFAVIGSEGVPVAYATSVWAAIGAHSRQPADLVRIYGSHLPDYIDAEKPCPVAKYTRHRLQGSDAVGTLVPKYGDIDGNGHVNSIRYIDHLLDLFPLDYYRTHRVQRVEIAYNTESFYGEELSIFQEEPAPGEFLFEVKHHSGETVCSSRIIFNNR